MCEPKSCRVFFLYRCCGIALEISEVHTAVDVVNSAGVMH